MATEGDEPERGAGKHAFGDASHSGLVHYASECGTDEPKIDLYTSPDLHECNLLGTDEERRFLGGVFQRISIPEAEYFFLSRQYVDILTRDVEVASIKALLLARGARLCHGHIEEKLAASEKREEDLKVANDALTKQVSFRRRSRKGRRPWRMPRSA